jgi:hypothetical protein
MDPGSNAHRVSIGLPVYDGERYLRAALDGLLSQTVADFELIIADNASTDGTEVICGEYAEADPHIRYLRNPTNVGSLRNFNLAFGDARGAYLKWAAHDDLVEPEFPARCLEPSNAILPSSPATATHESSTSTARRSATTRTILVTRAMPVPVAAFATCSRKIAGASSSTVWCAPRRCAPRVCSAGTSGPTVGCSPSSLCAAALLPCPTTCFSAETTPSTPFAGSQFIIYVPGSRIPRSRATGCYRIGGFSWNTREPYTAPGCRLPSKLAAMPR